MGSELNGIPAAIPELWESIPPILQALLRIRTMKFVVSKRRVNPNMGGAPRFRFRMKYDVVVNHIARERHVAIQEDGGRGLLGNLLHEPLPNRRIRGPCIRGIRKAHIAI